MQHNESLATPTPSSSSAHRWVLAAIVVFFVAIRATVVICAPGGQDEEWYGIPGLTIAQEGVPRVPYSRATSENSVFYGADQVLYAQPPLSFYLQSPFFAVLSPTYTTARLASLLGACVSIVTTYFIARILLSDFRVALLGATLFSLSRLCFFPAVLARPDMLCGMFGLLSVALTALWYQRASFRWLVLAGASVGLAALCHPFAIVFAVQLSIWILSGGSLRNRLKGFVCFALSVTAAFSLWLPLISVRADLFRAQFIGNILRPTGPGLLSRFVFPYESFADQVPQLIERAHPIQFSMLCTGLIGSGIMAWRNQQPGLRVLWLLAVSSVYLLVVFLGTHPIQGFWCYSAAIGWLCFGFTLLKGIEHLSFSAGQSRLLKNSAICIAVIAMFPGSGARAIIVYATHLNDPIYNGSKFTRMVLEDLPEGSSLTVGPEFSLDAYGQGWRVILACRHPMYFDSAEFPTEYYVFGRRDLAEGLPQPYECEFIRSYGNKDDIFANYAEVYRQR